jgi:hypothetical protein
MVGYRLEDDSIANDMLDVLESTNGALPLLQFAAAQLWEKRDRQQKMLTVESYREIGGVAGALASHADEVLRGMASSRQKLVRAIFQRLVTGDRTRAIVDIDELEGLAEQRGEIAQVIDQMVSARLLVVQTGDDERASTVEIVHESLISSWPTLQRWLDDDHEDRVFLAQLSSVARQWDRRGRPQGLLWRGEAATEARRWRERSQAALSGAEKEFLNEVVSLSTRSTRRRRVAVIASLVILATIAAGAVVAVAFVVQAEQAQAEQADRAKAEAEKAKLAEKTARAAEKRSRDAEAKVKAQLELLQEKERQRKEASERATKASAEVELSRAELKDANRQLRIKADQAERERQKAKKAAADAKAAEARARKAQARAEALYRKEKKRAEALQKQAKKIADKLR